MRWLIGILIVLYVFGYLSMLLWYDKEILLHKKLFYLWEKTYIVLTFYILYAHLRRYGYILILPLGIAVMRLIYEILLIFTPITLNQQLHINGICVLVILFIMVVRFGIKLPYIGYEFNFKTMKWQRLKDS